MNLSGDIGLDNIYYKDLKGTGWETPDNDINYVGKDYLYKISAGIRYNYGPITIDIYDKEFNGKIASWSSSADYEGFYFASGCYINEQASYFIAWVTILAATAPDGVNGNWIVKVEYNTDLTDVTITPLYKYTPIFAPSQIVYYQKNTEGELVYIVMGRNATTLELRFIKINTTYDVVEVTQASPGLIVASTIGFDSDNEKGFFITRNGGGASAVDSDKIFTFDYKNKTLVKSVNTLDVDLVTLIGSNSQTARGFGIIRTNNTIIAAFIGTASYFLLYVIYDLDLNKIYQTISESRNYIRTHYHNKVLLFSEHDSLLYGKTGDDRATYTNPYYWIDSFEQKTKSLPLLSGDIVLDSVYYKNIGLGDTYQYLGKDLKNGWFYMANTFNNTTVIELTIKRYDLDFNLLATFTNTDTSFDYTLHRFNMHYGFDEKEQIFYICTSAGVAKVVLNDDLSLTALSLFVPFNFGNSSTLSIFYVDDNYVYMKHGNSANTIDRIIKINISTYVVDSEYEFSPKYNQIVISNIFDKESLILYATFMIFSGNKTKFLIFDFNTMLPIVYNIFTLDNILGITFLKRVLSQNIWEIYSINSSNILKKEIINITDASISNIEKSNFTVNWGNKNPVIDIDGLNYYIGGQHEGRKFLFAQANKTISMIQDWDDREIWSMCVDDIEFDSEDKAIKIIEKIRGNNLIQYDTTRAFNYVANPSVITKPVIERPNTATIHFMRTAIPTMDLTTQTIWVLLLAKQTSANGVDVISDATGTKYFPRLLASQDNLQVRYGNANIQFNLSVGGTVGHPTQWRYYAIKLTSSANPKVYIGKENGDGFYYEGTINSGTSPEINGFISLGRTTELTHGVQIRGMKIINTFGLTAQAELNLVNQKINEIGTGSGFTWTDLT